MKLRTKAVAVFAALLALQLAAALFSLQRGAAVEHSLRRLMESSLGESEALADVHESLHALHLFVLARGASGGLASGRASGPSSQELGVDLRRSLEAAAAATTRGRRLAQLSGKDDEAEAEALELEANDLLAAHIAQLLSWLGEYEHRSSRGDSQGADEVARRRLLPLLERDALPLARELHADAVEEVHREATRALEVMEATRVAVEQASVFLFLLALALAYAAMRSFLGPLRALSTAAEEVRSGNLAHRVRHEAADEFGQLSAAFDDMAATLEQHASEQRRAHEEVTAREQSLAVTLRCIGEGVIATDSEGRVIQLNAVGETLTGWSAAEALGQPLDVVFRVVNESTRAPILGPSAASLEAADVPARTRDAILLARGGAECPIAHTYAQIRDVEQRVSGAAFVFRDTAAEREARGALRAAAERQSFLLSATNAVLYTCEAVPNYDATYISPNIREVLGYESEEFLKPGFWGENIHPDDAERVFAELGSLFTEGTHHHEYRFRHKDGSWRHMSDRLRLVHGGDGELVELVGSFYDVTERHNEREQAEARLREANEGLEGLVAARTRELEKIQGVLHATQRLAHVGSFRRHIASGAAWWSPETYRILGLDEATFSGDRLGAFRAAIHPDDRRRIGSMMAKAEAEGTTSECRIVRPDQQVRHVAIAAERMVSDGQEEWVQGAIQDITDRVHTEDAVRQSLSEKELLLKEIHHRVKNNLQIISSLLRMQSETAEPSIQVALRDGVHRVRSMALIHERLYQTTGMGQIDFGEYATVLVGYLFRSYSPVGEVELLMNTERVDLNIETAVPCGLILNELVSNALKHGFGDGNSGELEVTVESAPGGRVRLGVRDTGRGLPADFDVDGFDSLGMLLVSSLTQQLKGTLAVSGEGGAYFEVLFRELESHGPN